MSVFPEYPWLPWKFNTVPRKFWENSENKRKFMDWLYKELQFTSMEDWYKVTPEVIILLP